MELIKTLWVVIFLLFSLTLLVVWSKISIISKKVENIESLLKQSEQLDQKKTVEGA